MEGSRVWLIGYVGQHLTTRKLSNGSKRVSIRMATHYDHRDEKGGRIDHTVWHDVVAWDHTAEYAERSFVRGSRIMVEGRIDYRVFRKQDGSMYYGTQIRASNLINLDR